MDQCQQSVAAFSLQDAIVNAEEAMQQEASQAPAVEYITPLEVSEFQCESIDPTQFYRNKLQKTGVALTLSQFELYLKKLKIKFTHR